jgi:hypothetical protein
VRRSILADTDRVVRCDTDESELLQGGHASGWGGVQPEHEESGHNPEADQRQCKPISTAESIRNASDEHTPTHGRIMPL